MCIVHGWIEQSVPGDHDLTVAEVEFESAELVERVVNARGVKLIRRTVDVASAQRTGELGKNPLRDMNARKPRV
jgi:hypothetical protein